MAHIIRGRDSPQCVVESALWLPLCRSIQLYKMVTKRDLSPAYRSTSLGHILYKLAALKRGLLLFRDTQSDSYLCVLRLSPPDTSIHPDKE